MAEVFDRHPHLFPIDAVVINHEHSCGNVSDLAGFDGRRIIHFVR